MTATVRPAAPADMPFLPEIEQSGEAMFAAVGIVFSPGPATIEAAIADGADIFVIGDPPLGFAAVLDVDGHPHLEQISVHADHGRRGLGTLLLTEVMRRSRPGLTLLTFRDIPWNGPWYAKHGFVELPESGFGPALRAKWNAEIDAGLHVLGPRLAMRQARRDRRCAAAGSTPGSRQLTAARTRSGAAGNQESRSWVFTATPRSTCQIRRDDVPTVWLGLPR